MSLVTRGLGSSARLVTAGLGGQFDAIIVGIGCVFVRTLSLSSVIVKSVGMVETSQRLLDLATVVQTSLDMKESISKEVSVSDKSVLSSNVTSKVTRNL